MADGVRRKKLPGLSVSTAMLASGLLVVLILGSALLKTRHLRQAAERTRWQGPGFELVRPNYDRTLIEAEDALTRNPDARRLFAEGMVDFLHAEDRDAQSRFLRAASQEPEWPMLRFYLGTTRLFLGFPVAAAADLQRAADAGFAPPGGSSLWWLAVARLYCGETEEGYRLLDRVATGDSPQAAAARRILDHRSTPPEESR